MIFVEKLHCGGYTPTRKELKKAFARKHNQIHQSDGEYYQTHKESRNAYAKKYRQKNVEKIKVIAKKYREKNKEVKK